MEVLVFFKRQDERDCERDRECFSDFKTFINKFYTHYTESISREGMNRCIYPLSRWSCWPH